jgi:hypothetical protein
VEAIGTTRFEPGWHEGVEMSTYLADPAVSASKLWKLHTETAAHLRHELLAGPRPSGAPQELGNLLHTAVYEPDAFDDRYVILGQCEGRKKDGDQCSYRGSIYRDGQSFCGTHDPAKGEPEAPGVYAVAGNLRDSALAMKETLLAHPTARELLKAPGPREITVVWEDEATGLWCRIRPDHLIQDDPTVRPAFRKSEVNLKSTGLSAADEPFTKYAERLGFYFKAAFYRMGLAATEFWPHNQYYPVVESTPPHEVIVYRLDEDALDIGENEVKAAMLRLAECVRTGEWPGYGREVHHLTLPEWRLRQVQRIESVGFAEAS